MKIANIVTTQKISVSDEFNVVTAMGNIIHGLPTLIVGYDYVNKHYPKFDITNSQLEPNLYWTFKRTERRDKFEEDLNWFITMVYDDLTKKIKYIFVDPIQLKPRSLRKIIRKLHTMEYKVTYVHGDMIYIHGEDLIFGIDMKLLKFMSMNVEKIKDKIKTLSNVFLNDNKILIEYRKNVGMLGYQVRYIPFLYTISHGQNNTSSIIHIPREGGMVS